MVCLFGVHLSRWQTVSIAIPEVWQSDQYDFSGDATLLRGTVVCLRLRLRR